MATQLGAEQFDEAMRRRTSNRTPPSLGGPLQRLPLDEAAQEFFKTFVPQLLMTFLGDHSYPTAYTLGRLTFDCVNEMRLSNQSDANKQCLDDGLLIVGSGLNGDPIVIDLEKDFRMGFVFHDRLWSRRPTPTRAILIDTSLSIGTFYLAAVLPDSEFPRDAYDAKELKTEDWDSLRTTATDSMRRPGT